MNKIYKRNTLIQSNIKKVKNEKNRLRNVIVNFRMSQDEKDLLDQKIKLSGLAKQDYMAQAVLNNEVVVIGNVRVFDEMEKQLYVIEDSLKLILNGSEVEHEKLEILKFILEMYKGLNCREVGET